MTVGEKIQYYRKKCGFSQEELGQRLLVSRQTISLWEMDKTLPTVDNLVRLKEIFGVSIDEMLDTAQIPTETNLSQCTADQAPQNLQNQQDSDKKSLVYSSKKEWKVGSILLFVFSIFSVPLAFVTLGFVAKNTDFPEEYYWIFFLYVLIPLGSIVYGMLLKRKGYGGKKNVIIGGLMAGMLSVFGLLFGAISLTYSHSDELLIKAEETIGIDIPVYRLIQSEDEVYDDGAGNKKTKARCYVYFDDDKVETFEREMAADDKWMTTLPTYFVGIVADDYGSEHEYFLICNVDTKEINRLPKESGEYYFICLLYDVENNQLEIIEYVVEYVA